MDIEKIKKEVKEKLKNENLNLSDDEQYCILLDNELLYDFINLITNPNFPFKENVEIIEKITNEIRQEDITNINMFSKLNIDDIVFEKIIYAQIDNGKLYEVNKKYIPSEEKKYAM